MNPNAARDSYVTGLRADDAIRYVERVVALTMYDYHEVLSVDELVAELANHPALGKVTERRMRLALERLRDGGHLDVIEAGQGAA